MAYPRHMNITTKYQTNAQGVGRIVARSGNRQRTVPYDHALSHHANHGAAAGVLAVALGVTTYRVVDVTADLSTYTGKFRLS